MSLRYYNFLTIFLASIILLLAAYINGFPIVYSDTSTFLASGFELSAPFDRPITYGLFLRLTSLNGASLWLVAFFQTLLLSTILYMVFNAFIKVSKHKNLMFIISISVLTLTSSISWINSQLISDIFTPIMLLSFLLLILKKHSKRKTIFLYTVFTLSTAMHMSHISYNVLLIAIILLLRFFNIFQLKFTININPVFICLGLSLLSILSMGSAISKSKHGFLMGALVEHGIAKQFLNDNCKDNNFEFCKYKDELPEKGWQFLWDDNSPFYKMGDWKGTKKEFNTIIFETLTTPKYLKLLIIESVKATYDQLLKFNIGDGNGAFMESTILHKRVEKYFPHELSIYQKSKQNNEKLFFINDFNKTQHFFIIIALISLLIFLVRIKKSDKSLNTFLILILIGILLNAWSCGTLANAIDRLGSKMIWLIPFVVLIISFNISTKTPLKLHKLS